MANVDVLNLNGEKVGSLELADAVFAPDQVNEALLWEAVKHYRASLRQGTHKTKSRTEVAGSGKKLWKQKGTGRARIGSVRSPLWRHGYTVHGPQPRSYDYAFPRKKLLGALRSALASKLADGKLTVVDSLEIKEAKTKLYRAALDKLDVTRTALLVENGKTLTQALVLGARNLEGVELVLNNEVHPYDLLRYERAIFSKAAIEQLTEALEKIGVRSASSPRRRRPHNADSLYRDSPPADYRKGAGREGDRGDAGVRRGARRHQDRSEAGRRGALQGEGGRGSHRQCAGQGTPPRQVTRASGRTGRRLTSG